MRVTGAIILVATACAGPHAVRAEVRLQRGQSTAVRVVPTTRGPWSPLGRVDADLLNASGDLRGDGSPVLAKGHAGTLVAWMSPSSSAIELAIGRDRWTRLRAIVVVTGASAPLVQSLGDGWVVGWSADDDVRLASVTRDGVVSDPVSVTEGTLLALGASGRTIHLLSRAGGSLVLSAWIPVPEPTPVIFATVGTWQLRDLARVPPSADPTAPWPALHDLGDGRSALTWWLTPTSLAVVALGEDGPDGEATIVTAPGRGHAYPDALARQALRDLARP